MNYYLDTEFIEGKQKMRSIYTSAPTIDLISIGIVCEDSREYYAICSEFNTYEAWNRFQLEQQIVEGSDETIEVKNYWLRDNVLKPIHKELCKEELNFDYDTFNYKSFRTLIKKYGKTKLQIANEIKDFVSHKDTNLLINHLNFTSKTEWTYDKRMDMINARYPQVLPVFHAYYADYDWVGFCWLFGRMINLPKGFPMYCIDLKQTLDEKAKGIAYGFDVELGLKSMKRANNYPKETNEHNALADARWCFELHKFLKSF